MQEDSGGRHQAAINRSDMRRWPVFDVIDFLERVGQDAQLRHASQDEVGLVLPGAEVDPELRVAILARDGPRLQALLGRLPSAV